MPLKLPNKWIKLSQSSDTKWRIPNSLQDSKMSQSTKQRKGEESGRVP
jgi:hypothetical protein